MRVSPVPASLLALGALLLPRAAVANEAFGRLEQRQQVHDAVVLGRAESQRQLGTSVRLESQTLEPAKTAVGARQENRRDVWETLRSAPVELVDLRPIRSSVPELAGLFARHGIRLERFSEAGGQVTGYEVAEPATQGLRVRLDIWRFTDDVSEAEIRDYVMPYARFGHVRPPYVLWHPWAVNDPGAEEWDDEQRAAFERLQARIVELFRELPLP